LLPLLKKKGSSVFLVLFRQEEQGIGPYAVRAENPPFEPFIYEKQQFAKTGSGQT
jgi:hypothetical protein